MMWFLVRKPSILGGDIPRWDRLDKPQGFWEKFFRSGTLMVGPLTNLENVTRNRAKLVVLPMKVEKTPATPCRAIILEE
jgi:kynurenine formamidase